MKNVAIVLALLLFHPVLLQATPPKSGEIEASVIKQIENDTAKQFKLGKVKAKCDKAPANPKDGDSFACSATTKDNKKVQFTAKLSVKDGGKIKVALIVTNILDRASIIELVKKVLPDIQDQTGEKVELKDVDCGSFFVFASAADMLIPCTVKIPSDSQKKKAEIHFTKKLVTVKVQTDKDTKVPEVKSDTNTPKTPDAKPKQP